MQRESTAQSVASAASADNAVKEKLERLRYVLASILNMTRQKLLVRTSAEGASADIVPHISLEKQTTTTMPAGLKHDRFSLGFVTRCVLFLMVIKSQGNTKRAQKTLVPPPEQEELGRVLANYWLDA